MVNWSWLDNAYAGMGIAREAGGVVDVEFFHEMGQLLDSSTPMPSSDAALLALPSAINWAIHLR